MTFYRKLKAKKQHQIDHLAYNYGLQVFCDGACEPNPGPGSWAFVAYQDGEEIHSGSGFASASTNNRMEMTAALAALEWISQRYQPTLVQLHSDSQYTVRGCNEWRHRWKAKGWRRKQAEIPNADLWQLLDAALVSYPLALTWVPGHSGVTGNERADRLASYVLNTMTRRCA